MLTTPRRSRYLRALFDARLTRSLDLHDFALQVAAPLLHAALCYFYRGCRQYAAVPATVVNTQPFFPSLNAIALLQRLPPECLELGWWIRSLWLSYNDLDMLPICIEEMTTLKTLHLHHNRILRLPPTLGISLTSLKDLDICYNPAGPARPPPPRCTATWPLRRNAWPRDRCR